MGGVAADVGGGGEVVSAGSRPLGLRKETGNDRRWRRFCSGPLGWLWTCHICRLEATWPMDTLVSGYADALEHLEDEHLGRRR